MQKVAKVFKNCFISSCGGHRDCVYKNTQGVRSDLIKSGHKWPAKSLRLWMTRFNPSRHTNIQADKYIYMIEEDNQQIIDVPTTFHDKRCPLMEDTMNYYYH
jgi:hypothetical protein